MESSKIGWTDHTFNPWWGCHKVSEACKYCYIGQIMRRAGRNTVDLITAIHEAGHAVCASAAFRRTALLVGHGSRA